MNIPQVPRNVRCSLGFAFALVVASGIGNIGCGGASSDPSHDSTPVVDLPRTTDSIDAGAVKEGDADARDADHESPIAALRPDVNLGVDCTTDAGHATQLACTGLYLNWSKKTLGLDVEEYDPALHLWSDGAEKSRFIWLPPGGVIDTSDMDEWVFPLGTKLWKEFRIRGKRAETRYLEKRADGSWFRTTYVWSEDESRAEERTIGVLDFHGTGYEIPAQDTCVVCHQGRQDEVLGFEAIGLSHASATGLTMAKLIAQGKVSRAPLTLLRIPGTPVESEALGWLHANCGNACHNGSPNALAGYTGLRMRLTAARLGTVDATNTWQTAVNVPSFFQPVEGELFFRIAPRDNARSLITYRISRRDDALVQQIQMPPLATRLVDTAEWRS